MPVFRLRATFDKTLFVPEPFAKAKCDSRCISHREFVDSILCSLQLRNESNRSFCIGRCLQYTEGQRARNASLRWPHGIAVDDKGDIYFADFANSRIYALKADGTTTPGWPKKVGQIQRDLLPVVGEGITGNPVIGPVACPNGGDG